MVLAILRAPHRGDRGRGRAVGPDLGRDERIGRTRALVGRPVRGPVGELAGNLVDRLGGVRVERLVAGRGGAPVNRLVAGLGGGPVEGLVVGLVRCDVFHEPIIGESVSSGNRE